MSPQIPTPPQPLDSSAPQSAAGAAATVNSPAGDTCARQAASSHLQPIDVLKRDSAGTPTSDTGSDAGVSSSREQKFKNRCFKCKTKIPLALQITNKCRCEYIFCNSHKHPDEHSCDFDHKSEGKAILAMNSPKLDDNRGGRSFNRLV